MSNNDIAQDVVPNPFQCCKLDVSIVIKSLRNINCLNGTFDVTFVIHVNWLPISEDDWEPNIVLKNAVDIVHIEKKTSMNTTTFVKSISVYVTGIFWEHYELIQFPYDYQRLHIDIEFTNCPINKNQIKHRELIENINMRKMIHTVSSHTFDWYPGKYEINNVNISMMDGFFKEFDSWEIVHLFNEIISCTNPELDPNRISFCKLIMYMTVSRRPNHYFWYFVFPVSIQVLVGFTTFFIKPHELGNKLQVSLNIMLTMFAVKFSSNLYLPTMSNVTYLERYFILNVMISIMIIINNVIVYIISEVDNENNTLIRYVPDIISGSFLLILYLLIQTFFYITMLSQKARNRFISIIIDKEDTNMAIQEKSFIVPQVT
jgi:hypothetical protein